MNTKIEDVREMIGHLYPRGCVVDEHALTNMFYPVRGLIRHGVDPVVIQMWLDRMRQEGFLRMEGFKYFTKGDPICP